VKTGISNVMLARIFAAVLMFGVSANLHSQTVAPVDVQVSEVEAEVAESVVTEESAVTESTVAEASVAGEAGAVARQVPAAPVKLDEEMEDVKKALLALKRDLVILEEDLLFPASSQVSVFLSMDVGEFFQLDAVTVKVNGKEVAHHLYTEKQVDALFRGGVQKLYVGNVKQGNNRVTAFFTGRGPKGRDFKRATTVEFEKGFEPTFVELAISDETSDYQPDFVAAVSE